MLRPVALLLPPMGELLFCVVAPIALGHGLFEGVAHFR